MGGSGNINHNLVTEKGSGHPTAENKWRVKDLEGGFWEEEESEKKKRIS